MKTRLNARVIVWLVVLGTAAAIAGRGRLFPPAQAQQGDSRLVQTVSLDVRAETLGALAQDLSSKTGVALTVTPDIKDRQVSVFISNLSLGYVLARLGNLYGFVWQTQTSQTTRSYRLIRPDAVRRREEAALQDEIPAFQRRLQVWKEWADAGAAGEAAFDASHPNLLNAPGLSPWWSGTDATPGSGQIIARLFFSLPQQQQTSVTEGQPVRIPWSSISDTYRKPMEQMIAQGLAAGGPVHKAWSPPDPVTHQRKLILDEHPVLLPNAFDTAVVEFYTKPEEVGPEKAVYLTISPISVEQPGIADVMVKAQRTYQFAFAGQGGQVVGYHGTFKELSQFVDAQRIKPVEATNPDLVTTLRRVTSFPRVEGWKPLPDLLELLHQKIGFNIIADYHPHESGIMPSETGPLGGLLEVFGIYSYRHWSWDSGNSKGLLLLRSKFGILKDIRDPQETGAGSGLSAAARNHTATGRRLLR